MQHFLAAGLTCGDLHQVVRPALNLEGQGVAQAGMHGCVAVVWTLQKTAETASAWPHSPHRYTARTKLHNMVLTEP